MQEEVTSARIRISNSGQVVTSKMRRRNHSRLWIYSDSSRLRSGYTCVACHVAGDMASDVTDGVIALLNASWEYKMKWTCKRGIGNKTHRHPSKNNCEPHYTTYSQTMAPSEKLTMKARVETLAEHCRFREDYRGRLPGYLSRFTGYKPPNAQPPYDPLRFPPFSWLKYIPLKLEVCIFTWIGSFGGILLIEAIMSANTAFQEVYHAPIIITSFGASAVLLFSAIESPLAQPRNFVLGHFVSALVGTCITRLFVLNPHYHPFLDEGGFHGNVFVNGGLSMATSALAQVFIGAVHPP